MSAKSAKDASSTKFQHPYTNPLIHTSSPYLLEHAHNPVYWYPWGEEALQKARDAQKPLIISIGYSACHWCHVMERECYADPEVADYMNAHFVSIKVDREERPDVDQIYMQASQLISGSGGWPLNAFALPDGRPFFVVTYRPKAGWLDLLAQIVSAYTNQPQQVTEQAAMLTRGLRSEENLITTNPTSVGPSEKIRLYRQLLARITPSVDFEQGGLGRAPKFPMPGAWEWLLQYAHFTGEPEAMRAVSTTLDHMALGGIYDQLGGGFARYATDHRWQVPHFEKMLYDNGQLVSLYAHGYQMTGSPLYRRVLEETLQFVQQELTSPEGGFYASLNADSEGEEGKFYVWTASEIQAVLGKEAEIVCTYFGITSTGNWEEGKNVFGYDPAGQGRAMEMAGGAEAWRLLWEKARKALFKARDSRPRPSTDHKILTSWNALMLKGYLDAYRALGRPEYLEAALENAHFLQTRMRRADGGLWRNYMDGQPAIPALLDDYALLAEACMALYEVTFDRQWLDWAQALGHYALDHFSDEASPLCYYTPDDSPSLIARKKEVEDQVIPSSNAVLAHTLYRLGIVLSDATYQKRGEAMLEQMLATIPEAVPYFSCWTLLLGLVSYGVNEVAILGEKAQQMAVQLQHHYLPAAVFLGGNEENLPLLRHKKVTAKTVIYVCHDHVCQRPVTVVKEALDQLQQEKDQE